MTLTRTGSLAEYLPHVAAHTPPSLVSADTFAQLATVAGTLPGSLAHTFGFECPLGDNAPHADLLVGARADHGRRGLAELVRDARTHPAATRLRDFAIEWSDPSTRLGGTVDNVWLEFDISGPNRTVPSVFFGFQPVEPHEGWGPAEDVQRQFQVTRAAVSLLRAGELPASLTAALRRCFLTLPTAQVFQVGVMLSRSTDAVRLCLRLRSFDDVPTYLDRVSWGGDLPALLTTLEPLAGLADYVCLDVDVNPQRMQPKVGLECYAIDPQRWPSLLDALVLHGLCTASKREALLAFPGHGEETDTSGLWPPPLTRASSVLGRRSASVCHRSLHHVKVVHHPQGAAEAKAYLAVGYRWRPVEP